MHNTAAAKPSDDMISSKSETTTVNSESCQSYASDIEILHQNCPTAFDIGLHYNNIKDLSDLEKFDLLNNVWKPSEKFKFPCNANSRKFQLKWLQQFPWLAYSKQLDGAFCVSCVLFANTESSVNAARMQQLYASPFRTWSKALKKFRDHASKSQMHLSASLRITCFRQQMEHKAAPIDLQLNKIESDTIKKNREKLVPIVETIIVFGRQNIPLRGHRDDSAYYNVVEKNPGNLQEILKLIARCGGNSVFKEHIISAPKNATYRSKTTQSEIIEICGEEIVQKLVSEILEVKFFSVLADEAADVSQVSKCLW